MIQKELFQRTTHINIISPAFNDKLSLRSDSTTLFLTNLMVWQPTMEETIFEIRSWEIYFRETAFPTKNSKIIWKIQMEKHQKTISTSLLQVIIGW